MASVAEDEAMSRAEAALEESGQSHLLEGLEGLDRKRLLMQAANLDAAYSGGLRGYVENARRLLAASGRGDSPYEGCVPKVPEGERLNFGDSRFLHLESVGLREMKDAAFVLVAGGLGERLGFQGIKLALPVTVVTGWCFLELYCRSILALQQQGSREIPLIIMTSGDTHERTLALLEEGNYFGLPGEGAMPPDSDARLSRDPKDPCLIETKPHGHGDVHALLHSSGLARKLYEEGRRWLIFFQDTSSLFFKVAVAALGASAELGFDMNSFAAPRRPKDAMGAITRLERSDGSAITINVEYNQLEPLLLASGYDGDYADDTGYSPFPGNMNALVISMGAYVPTLERTGGIIAEFVNPKYADATRTKFKSSTRLECMMQDLPKELPADAKVGFTMFETWCSYSPVKNDPASARQKFQSGNHPQSGTTGESDFFAANCRILRMAGATVEDAQPATFNGITVPLEARVVWSPSWALGLAAVTSRLANGGSKIWISQRSTLVLDGDILLESLHLDGALRIVAKPGARVRVVKLSVKNEGWEMIPTGEDEEDQVARIRGFRLKHRATQDFLFGTDGEHVINEDAPA
eukprot:CAMPEP_0170583456 /NCGR_PEP_ID=MMETSP0224-20130122/8145_1 /TAXON_ID=285029 /ORGANISM="Togula jolla, Strain CCCM 725" /LENGTH=580 /DNA_ID=CAMNT_0010906785 /DNA_START=77 /DNA_END=1820 /DNA_ORIENTATION=-